MSAVIKVENLYKQYRLGEVGTGSMKDDLKRWRYKIMGREDPFLIIGEENDRTVKATSKYVWALKDINFEVQQGEILGIIGKNGAGKSTLLKILSRTTGPTKGSLKMKGRVASLLEVGTGFHAELSGRENIYLNGSIMGMRRNEITRKLDEIIDFAGVEKYIDTPVKRYSSGMYVRLAFGVAAHLEPDIMIVDEVLAVGDAEFQKKALGKMKDVSSKGGRTVLFVSHNLAAVQKLCDTAILLSNGNSIFDGRVKDAVNYYIQTSNVINDSNFINNSSESDSDILEIKVLNANKNLCSKFHFNEGVHFSFTIKLHSKHLGATLGFRVKDQIERNIFTSEVKLNTLLNKGGIFEINVDVPSSVLTPNNYTILVAIHIVNKEVIASYDSVVGFEILETGTNLIDYYGTDYGCVFISCNWSKTDTKFK